MLEIVETWWDFIFHDLMNGSTALMVLFGWELFLLPLGVAFALATFLIWGVGAAFAAIFDLNAKEGPPPTDR